MDVARATVLSLVLVYSWLPGQAAADVEYISPERRQELETQFNSASFDAATDAKKIEERSWSCDMYGARSHMQAQHGLKLYTLTLHDGEWRNSGAQLVNRYKSESGALVGRKDRFEDQVKITKDGQLVSRLSLSNAAKTVVAYSVCKTL